MRAYEIRDIRYNNQIGKRAGSRASAIPLLPLDASQVRVHGHHLIRTEAEECERTKSAISDITIRSESVPPAAPPPYLFSHSMRPRSASTATTLSELRPKNASVRNPRYPI